jgi:hypothetical protein
MKRGAERIARDFDTLMEGFIRLVVTLYAYVLLFLPFLYALGAVSVTGVPLGTVA